MLCLIEKTIVNCSEKISHINTEGTVHMSTVSTIDALTKPMLFVLRQFVLVSSVWLKLFSSPIVMVLSVKKLKEKRLLQRVLWTFKRLNNARLFPLYPPLLSLSPLRLKRVSIGAVDDAIVMQAKRLLKQRNGLSDNITTGLCHGRKYQSFHHNI